MNWSLSILFCLQFGPGQPMFFSPSSSVGSIPAMFDVQQPTEANFNVQPNTAMFAGPAMMQPMMMMSPQPSGMIISKGRRH